MIQSGNGQNDFPLETSIPQASLESILCTEELYRRPSRPPDYETENCALVKLVSALADSPSTILQTLAETILDITQCDSAGLSLLTRDGKTGDVCGERFYWPAIAGMWNPHVGGGTPRNFGPCGDVLDHNRTLLFRHFERRYPYLLPVIPAAEECLLVPFYVGGKAVGTIWAIMHSDRRRFDAEDDRVMASLGKFASSAYQALMRIEDLKFQVSQREKAEAEVRELARGLEAKVRRLVEANVVGIVMWNLEGAITGANEAFLRMVQFDREDLASGRVRWKDLTPAEWGGQDERGIAELKATGIFQPFEKEYFRKDGSRVPVLLGGALLEQNGDEGVAFVLDLSEQKRTEKALRRSEAYLAEAQRLSRTGSWHLNVSTGEVLWSKEFFEIFGFDPDKTKPTYSLNLERIHPEDRHRVEQVRRLGIREKRDFEVEYRIVLPGGPIKCVHSVAHCLVKPSGNIEYIGAVMDITERKLAEEKLARSEAFLAEAQKLSLTGSFSWKVATDEITWSEQVYRIYEFEIGVPVTFELIRTRVHPEDLTFIEKLKIVNQAGDDGNDIEYQYRLLMPDRSIKYLHAVAHATRDKDGQLEYLAAVQDVTARKLAEDARDKARAELAHVAGVMSLGTLAASIAHELNQPLSGIVTNASTCLRMLATDPPNVDGARETAHRAIRDGNRASEVVTRLRALFSKKDATTESVDLNDATREVIALLLSELQRNRLILRTELADDLPPVTGDRVQLQQVILNLLRNASDAMSTVDDRPRQLLVRTGRDEGDHVRLSVQDAGVGFDLQAADRLFDAFYTTKSDGMGMGLSVSRSIIDNHLGRLWATPNDGPGATFSFSIPCGRAGAMPAQSLGAARTPTATNVRHATGNL